MAWRGWAQRSWGCGQAWALGGRSPEELTTALAPPRLLGRRFNFFIQQKSGFRKAPRKVEPRRSDTGTSGETYKRSALIPPVEETVFYPSPYPIRTLVKPLFFTVGINKWWNNLSDGQRTVTEVLCSPMLLSTFSHFSLFHMAANMYVLWSFSSSIVNILGQEQFMAVYLSAGVISNFVSYVCKVATGRYGPSLGASGAIMTVLAAVCTKIPDGKLAIIFLPMFTFTAGNALKAIIAMDTAGMILGWKFFDHAAHLGGALFGIWYITYGHELIWKNREPLVKIWHEMRTNGPRKGGGSK
ncbi:presenilin-associated rhomboid-like protein, mitochondrial isoform X4 [Oryctolagus cuniculus]|uniref:presenilin-associated rhomboid-like protein, mitochondrial isoform X4 n=1 Tax=Oryctolagus cuniculus TaxID=9986 RepID=UPI0022312B30|nr:presenilins-associated rhomboid-like protein, mitochondrial isoform X4 [Oryctolagus cuniculus]